jgi:hypothetical protein
VRHVVRETWGERGVPSLPRLWAKRSIFEVKTVVAKYPSVAIPVARRRHGLPLEGDTEIVIEAFPRSGMTFAVVAFEMAQARPVRIACHVHAPAQVIAATRRHLPALVLVREPEPTILSFVIRHPHIPMGQALRGYLRFYQPLLRYRDSFVTSSFDEVTTDFGRVIRAVNRRFGTGFAEFEHTEENVERCFAMISDDYRERVRPGESLERIVARPSLERDRIKEALREEFVGPRLARGRERAETTYAALSMLGR